MPARGERARLGFAVADDADDEQVRVVERGAVGVDERVAELAALVDRSRRLGCHVARDAAREGELAKQPPQALLVVPDVGVHLAVGPFEVRVRDEGRSAVPGTGDEDRVEVVRLDHAVHVRVDEVEPRRRAPVAEQAGLDVLRPQRLTQQRVVEQVDLSDRQVVRSAPPAVDQVQLVGPERALRSDAGGAFAHVSTEGRTGGGGGVSSRTRASIASTPSVSTMTGLRSISTTSGCASTSALTRSRSSSSAAMSHAGAPR